MTRAFPATPLTVERRRTIRLLVVDGHPVIRSGVARIADDEADLDVVAETGTIIEATQLAETLRPDVATIGTNLLDGDGLTLARELRDRDADLGIVILTSRGEDDVLFRALETGASAFVSKLAPVPEILAAIRHAAVAATSFTAAGLAQALQRRLHSAGRLALSPREQEVLSLLQDGRSVPEIAAMLCISLSTAKTYVARLYEKLGATNRATALMTAVRLGFMPAAVV